MEEIDNVKKLDIFQLGAMELEMSAASLNKNLEVAGVQSAEILIPSIQKGMFTQTHFIFSGPTRSALSLEITLKGMEEWAKLDFEAAREKMKIGRDAYPYGCSEAQWWEYCMSPHSYLGIGRGKYQVGLNLFNRFLHVDIEKRTADLIDPKVGDEMLSTTNGYDSDRREIWFASWPVEATVRRMLDPRDEAKVTVWKYSIADDRSEQVWQGKTGDALHQLAVSPDRRFVILTELGLRFSDPVPVLSSNQDPTVWRRLRQNGVVPSEILVLDCQSGREWRLSLPTAGHVEFDPMDPEVFFISGHNIGLFGPKVGIFGNGVIQKYRLRATGPELLGEFSHSRFHRITTHIVFRHRDKTLIGVSGYPGTLFLIDAASMTLYKTFDLEAEDVVDTADFPHICRDDSYGIAATPDGESVLIAGSGFIRLADIADGCFRFDGKIEDYPQNSCFTGHMGIKAFPEKE